METLGTFLHHVTELYGPRPALLCQPRYRTETWSYTRVWEESTAIAAWLGERGMAKGDRVVLWAPNSPRWVAVFFGCARIGAIVVPLDVRSSPDFVSRVVAQTEPCLAIIAGALAGAWPHATDTMRMEDLEDIPRPGNGPVEDTACPDDIAEVIFTSGTTGDPKGVMLTHV
ncbi:MAG: hypothetical protein NVSMB65_09350 [Chloroflexota bacterium]